MRNLPLTKEQLATLKGVGISRRHVARLFRLTEKYGARLDKLHKKIKALKVETRRVMSLIEKIEPGLSRDVSGWMRKAVAGRIEK